MADLPQEHGGQLPDELLGEIRSAGAAGISPEEARARLEAAAVELARQARVNGMRPEAMLVILKDCLEASKLRLRHRAEFSQIRSQLVKLAIDAYFEGEK